jgi:hypothetical protein
MSFLDDFISIGKGFVGGVVKVFSGFANEVKHQTDRLISSFEKEFRADPVNAQEAKEHELRDINERIQHLREVWRNTSNQQEEWAFLKDEERKRLKSIIEKADRILSYSDIEENPGNYNNTLIKNENIHVLQYFVGQNTGGKICSCGMSMVLQWRHDLYNISIHDLYWGCSGWYHQLKDGGRACKRTERLSEADLKMFANLQRDEFNVDAAYLSLITKDTRVSNKIRAALNEIRGSQRQNSTSLKIYRCPIHGETMLLQQKRDADQLLDQFYLRCPRWLPNNIGCGFIVKLKSPAQISSVLDASTGSGIMRL